MSKDKKPPEQSKAEKVEVTSEKKFKFLGKDSSKSGDANSTNGKNNKAANGKSSSLGTSRGIESMFRNSYRAQLDMLALAALKANIMISLNGLLVSILFISGTYFLNVEPMLIIPLVSLLLTCTVAIVFAVLAARPVLEKNKHTRDDFRKDDADLLVFEHFAKLPRDAYLDEMQEMARSNDRIYNNMIVHIHSMGQTADRKFNRLYISYSAFMIGLVVSVLLLLGVVAHGAIPTVLGV